VVEKLAYVWETGADEWWCEMTWDLNESVELDDGVVRWQALSTVLENWSVSAPEK
jgi:hypothetical protein